MGMLDEYPPTDEHGKNANTKLYAEQVWRCRRLTDAQFGALIRACAEYAFDSDKAMSEVFDDVSMQERYEGIAPTMRRDAKRSKVGHETGGIRHAPKGKQGPRGPQRPPQGGRPPKSYNR